MRLTLLAVGRLRPALREACNEYLRRLGRYGAVVELEVREAGRAGNPAAQRREEGRRLADRFPPGATVVALSREGTPWTSRELAKRLGRWRDAGVSVAFVVGGAVGLDPALIDRAHYVWSMGPLTFPHELARMLVVEQLYRAWTILRGEPYHKGA